MFLSAGDGRWRSFRLGRRVRGCVRAGRGECVREIQLGRLDGRKARKAADFERRGALAKYLIWSLGGYGPLGSHSNKTQQ